ncbi:MAG: penicillin acylase family protein [Bacteroidetes bacterium]|nr:penicillin acylase family protein [Bacteroidota bacterium]
MKILKRIFWSLVLLIGGLLLFVSVFLFFQKELFGSKTLDVDKFFRTLGIAQHAEKSAQIFMSGPDTQTKKDVLAYLEGVNQYITRGRSRLEFMMLKIPKETFTVKDLFLIVDYISFNFQMGFKTDPLLTRMHDKLGDEYFKDIQYSHTRALKRDSIQLIPTISELSIPVELEKYLPVSIWSGSNSWAISSSRSISGKPLLSNDTHIGIQQPAVWYEAYLECPGFRFYGNFLAGFPFAPIGHTEHHGWGLTMLENDDIDFFKEKVSPDDTTLVYSKDHWDKISFRLETIKVKDSADVKINCRSTHHGPICSDVMPEFQRMTNAPVSVCWTFLNFNNNLMDATWKLAHANNLPEFREAVSMVAAPGLNIVYADRFDNIARYTAAKFVIRPDSVSADMLLDGSGKDDWLGYYDFSVNPKEENPELGFVLSCNNPPSLDSMNLFPGYYVPEDRFARLKHLMGEAEV